MRLEKFGQVAVSLVHLKFSNFINKTKQKTTTA